MNGMGCIDGQIKIIAHDAYTLHMVSVVMSDKHMFHVGNLQTVIVKSFFSALIPIPESMIKPSLSVNR